MPNTAPAVNIFTMAELQVQKTKGTDYKLVDVLDVAIQIRKFMDEHPRLSNLLLSGGDISRQLKYWYKKNGGINGQVQQM